MNPENFKKLLSTNAGEVNFWKDIVIGALPHLGILQSAYQNWSSLSREIKVKVQEAGYSELKYSEARTLKGLESLKYKRFAVIFAHAFDCWDVMQETFGACGSDSTEMNWNLTLEHDALKAINELENLIDSTNIGIRVFVTLESLRKRQQRHWHSAAKRLQLIDPRKIGYKELARQETVSQTNPNSDSSSVSELETLDGDDDSSFC